MPPVNQAAIASAGIIAVSVAVAAAIAVYESPELRRMADDLRRRIAIALHSLGDNVDPNNRPPMFNRPEDAEGFLRSRGTDTGEAVEADDETRRRQREELMYWNAKREENEARNRANAEPHKRTTSRGSSFDDFLQQDASAERGTYVFNTGADVSGMGSGNLLRHRGGAEGVRGLNASVYANPFADENGVDDFNDEYKMNLISPEKDEVLSDIYGATPLDGRTVQSHTLSPRPANEVLFDFDDDKSRTLPAQPMVAPVAVAATNPAVPLLERELGPNEYMTAGQEDRHEAYASIQAWAENATSGGQQTPEPMDFYSPLPMSPATPMSEPELVNDGQATPTGSGSDVGTDLVSVGAREEGSEYDVMSQDSEGISTPNTWSEVGSVVSESDAAEPVTA